MTSWYYLEAGQSVGPFLPDALTKLQQAGIIHDQTPVREGSSSHWLPFSEITAAHPSQTTAPANETPAGAPDDGYYYVDLAGRPVGPVAWMELQLLEANGRITMATMIARSGDTSWKSLAELMGRTPVEPTSLLETVVVRRSFRDFITLMGATITAYTFYVVPSYSRDLRTITGKPRMEFLPLLILGIVTLGIGLAVLLVIWAFDLEKHGQTNRISGRHEQLGAHVIGLSVLGFSGWFWSEWPVLVMGAVAGVWSVWLVQQEINLYAPAPELAP